MLEKCARPVRTKARARRADNLQCPRFLWRKLHAGSLPATTRRIRASRAPGDFEKPGKDRRFQKREGHSGARGQDCPRYGQGNRIKKWGHPCGASARAQAEGRCGVKDPVENRKVPEAMDGRNDPLESHGVLRLRDARRLRPPGIAPPQNDLRFDANCPAVLV